MMTTFIKAISATPGKPAGWSRATETAAKLIDTTTCIGCKACEVACQEWNNQQVTFGNFEGTYQTLPDLAHNFWNLIKFHETELDGQPLWLMSKYQCMHCVDPGCLKACPAPGAIVQYSNGIVDFNSDACIGCGYCMTGCPFDVPKLNPETKKVQKCTLCTERVYVGLEPACIKACPTNCLSFVQSGRRRRHACRLCSGSCRSTGVVRAPQKPADPLDRVDLERPVEMARQCVAYWRHSRYVPALPSLWTSRPRMNPG